VCVCVCVCVFVCACERAHLQHIPALSASQAQGGRNALASAIAVTCWSHAR